MSTPSRMTTPAFSSPHMRRRRLVGRCIQEIVDTTSPTPRSTSTSAASSAMPTKFGSNVDEDHRFELVVLNSNRSVRMGLRGCRAQQLRCDRVRRRHRRRTQDRASCVATGGSHPRLRLSSRSLEEEAIMLLAPKALTPLEEPLWSLNHLRPVPSWAGLRGTTWCPPLGWTERCQT
jgi:hypothetical protein